MFDCAPPNLKSWTLTETILGATILILYKKGSDKIDTDMITYKGEM